jgi:hypothetical protein
LEKRIAGGPIYNGFTTPSGRHLFFADIRANCKHFNPVNEI